MKQINFYLLFRTFYYLIFNPLLEMNNSSVILGSIALILAIYIFGSIALSYWLGEGNNVEYNIGCYVANHPLNRTDQILYRISDLQHAENMSQIHLSLQNQLTFDDTLFHNKSVQLALSFQKYIKKLTQQHDYNLENIQILREVSKSEKQYLSCKKTIDESYSDTACKDNWKQYLNCSKRMSLMRAKLQRLTEDQDLLQRQIAEVIKMPNNTISALDLAKRLYNDSMKLNEKLKNDLNSKLSPLEKRLRTKIFQKEQASGKYLLTYKNYRQCQDNKKKHTACEQISKQVRNINTQNIAYLTVMMESKQQLLKSLQRIMGSQKNSKQIEELNEKYLKHREEYIAMFKEFISLNIQNQKACGCTAEFEEQLKKDLEKFRRIQTTLNLEIGELNGQIDRLNSELLKCELQREYIVKRYKEALQQNEKMPRDSQTELTKMNRDLKNKFNQILELKSIYKNIVSECDKIKERMGKRVHSIGDINECISKKNYFLQLKKQTAPYIHSDNEQLNRMLQSKKQLGEYLSAFGSKQ